VDPDQAVFWLHAIGDVPEPVFIFAEFLGDKGDGFDGINLIELRGHAA
jgi:hypothetical protein